MHEMLVGLSERCGQRGAMDHIELFLSSPLNEGKVPHLVMLTSRPATAPERLSADDVEGAAVLYEYQAMGRGSGVFVTDDGAGTRTVIAAPEDRAEFAVKACEHMMRRGALITLMSYKEVVPVERMDLLIAGLTQRSGRVWGTQQREMHTYLTIEPTLDETLAHLGKHTRRNLRYYRRRAEADLQTSFDPEAGCSMSREEFLKLDQESTHPVGAGAMQKRFDDLRRVKGSFCVGVRDGSGRWLSLMGGRRHYALTEVDWQANRSGLEKYSLGTVMRAYFLEHEVELGTERLFFEGGTPHTMHHSFQTERAADVVAVSPALRARILRHFARFIFPEKNFLRQVLTGDSVHWQQR
jgi:hypothetical protein